MNKRPDGKAWFAHALVQNTRIALAKHLANRFTALFALVSLALVGITNTYAQSNADGSILGRVVGVSDSGLSGATATLSSKQYNITRSVKVSPAGTFEFPSVPVGDYEVTLALPGHEPITQATRVSIATTTSVRIAPSESSDALKLEKFVVSGADASPVDVAATSIGLNIRTETVTILPVARNMTAVSLLAPGVIPGDTGFFGDLATFAGASVGENAYYLNGFNITDFRRGLGFNNVPFEFFEDFQVLTSGYSAEFGRSTGGVVNAASKRGSNEFKASVKVVYEPKALIEKGYDTFANNGTVAVVRSVGNVDRPEFKSYNLQVSGPIWKNHLYFYGLYEGRDSQVDYIAPTTSSSRSGTTINQLNSRSNTSPFWAAKIDWQILKDHSFEYTTFSDKSDRETVQYPYAITSSNFVLTLPTTKGTPSTQFRSLGGRNNIYRYTGHFFDDILTLSALYGTSTRDDSITSTESDKPYIVDNRSGAGRLSGEGSLTEDLDRRHAKRLDGVVRFSAFGSHALKFGYDNENNKAHSLTRTSGDGIAYTYENYVSGPLQNSAIPPPGTTQIAQISVFANGGDFRVITEAEYIEDNWKLMNDRLSLNLGLRREMLDNRNGNDKTFIKITNMKAPRLAAAYDLKGDGLSKVTATWGRYFLQIPANTAARMASGETFYTDYYVLNSLKADNLPNLGPQVGSRTITGTGIVPGVETLVSTTIAPMYQDEFTVGYELALSKNWKASIKGIYRNLAQSIEDEAVDAALIKYAAGKGYNSFEAGGFDYYVLTNPGSDATFYVNMTKDLNADGIVDINDQSGGIATKEKVTLDAASLGYPKATRKYYAVYLDLERKFADKWFAHFSYVWSHSYGNYEGSVYSDIGQRDAGITQLFDQPGLVDGSYGNLPNDRRHVFKAYGAYQLTKEFDLGGLFTLGSGRPKNGLGLHPTDTFARVYGGSSYYVNGVLTPRGSLGTTPWVAQIDLSAHYKPKWGREKLTFGVDVFNIANWQTATAIFERSVAGTAPLSFYQKVRSIQTPRYFRFTAGYNF